MLPLLVTRRRQNMHSNTQKPKQRATQRTTARSSANLTEPNQIPTRYRYTLANAFHPSTLPHFNPIWHPGFPFRRSLRHRPPPRRSSRCACDRKTFASAVSHPLCASAHITRVAVLANGLLPPGRNPRRRRRRRCHRSCHRFCRRRCHSGEQCWHGHSPL